MSSQLIIEISMSTVSRMIMGMTIFSEIFVVKHFMLMLNSILSRDINNLLFVFSDNLWPLGNVWYFNVDCVFLNFPDYTFFFIGDFVRDLDFCWIRNLVCTNKRHFDSNSVWLFVINSLCKLLLNMISLFLILSYWDLFRNDVWNLFNDGVVNSFSNFVWYRKLLLEWNLVDDSVWYLMCDNVWHFRCDSVGYFSACRVWYLFLNFEWNLSVKSVRNFFLNFVRHLLFNFKLFLNINSLGDLIGDLFGFGVRHLFGNLILFLDVVSHLVVMCVI